jgi:hypothetical protein
MLRDDFKAGANAEPDQWNEGIRVTNPVHVVVPRFINQCSGSFGTPKKTVQNGGFYLPNRCYLSRRSCTSTPRIRRNVPTDEPVAEPAKRYLFDRPMLASFQGSTEDRHEDFISNAKVF